MDIYDNIDEMVALCRKKIELMIQLKKALRLAELLGVPPKDLKDKVSTRVQDTGGGSSYNPKPWKHKVFYVRVGGGPWDNYPLEDIHHDLWPDDMLQAYAIWQRQKAKLNKE